MTERISQNDLTWNRSACNVLVSIVMPAYNAVQWLAASIESVQAQTYGLWELLVVDDRSVDHTFALLAEMAAQDQRIRVIQSATNEGVATARNLALEQARGRYLAFLDSDDLWLPEKLAVQVAWMQEHRAAFSFTQYRRFSDAGAGELVPAPKQVTYRQLLRGNVIGCLTVMLDREVYPVVSMPSLHHEDYATWLGLLRGGGVAYGISQDLARYRVAAESVSANKAKAAGWTWRIYREHEKLSLIRSAHSFGYYFSRSIRMRLKEKLRRRKIR